MPSREVEGLVIAGVVGHESSITYPAQHLQPLTRSDLLSVNNALTLLSLFTAHN